VNVNEVNKTGAVAQGRSWEVITTDVTSSVEAGSAFCNNSEYSFAFNGIKQFYILKV